MVRDNFILIVEDCEDLIPPLQIALEAFYGCAVLHSPDGEHALATLETALLRAREMPLAVITDVNLPRKDGYDLISAVRRNPVWATLPILVASATSDPHAPERVRLLGADAFFLKPYSPADVCQSLERILHAKQLVASRHRIPGDADCPEPS